MLNTLIHWRERHLSDKQTTLILSFFIGLFASIAAYVLHSLIALIQHLLTIEINLSHNNWLYLVYPAVGILLTILFVRYVVKDNISHGITRILYAISSKRSHLRGHNCWTSVVASAITIGFGGSVGAEAPIVLTGSAIGSNLGKLFHIEKKTLLLLVGCGAAAAIAGIFKAPIAGLVFTLEVLMVDLSMASLLPILVACVTATTFTYIFTGSQTLFGFTLETQWAIAHTPACILLGIFCGMVSLYFIRAMASFEWVFQRLKAHTYWRWLLGAVVLSTLIFLFPSLYGEGYNAISILLNGETEADWNQVMANSLFSGSSKWLLLYIGLVILTKAFATSATNGAGGVGGTFAPSLFIGAFSGFFFARLWNQEQIGIYIPESNFTLLGMAGVMAGVMHAPLTGIFLIAEITGGYQLLMPLIIVSICAVLFIGIFEPHSIYAIRLAREGKLITHHIDHSVLTLMSLDSLISKEYSPLRPDMSLGQLVHTISESHTTFLPVLAEDGTLLGEVIIDNIRHVMFRTELYQRFTVAQVMTAVPAVVRMNDPMIDTMHLFETTDRRYLPVINQQEELVGYLSRTRTYSMYRKLVQDYSAE